MGARRQRFGLDSNCLIALLSGWHVHHRRTLSSYEAFLANGARPVIPAQAILECFSVLTRLPAPYRLPPETAKLAIEETFSRTALVSGLRPETVWNTLDVLTRFGLGGGRAYDAAIAFCVVESGAKVLLTWNTKHFLPIAPAGLEVREP